MGVITNVDKQGNRPRGYPPVRFVDLGTDQIPPIPFIPENYYTTLPFIPTSVSYELPFSSDGKLTSEPGYFGFNLHFEAEKEPPAKSVPWTYSKILNKLFMSYNTACPFQFQFINDPPEGTVIRAKAIYTKAEHVNYAVERCPVHASDDKGKESEGAPYHLIRCESTEAIYESYGPEENCVRSVLVPCKLRNTTYNYKLTCFSSCMGGMNRRPINFSFTLEKNGVIMGRILLDVRACACAGRDRHNEEKRFLKEEQRLTALQQPQDHLSEAHASTSNLAGDIKKVLQKIRSSSDNRPCKKRKKSEEIFNLQVRGRENYEVLTRIARALELAEDIKEVESEIIKKEP